MINTKKHLGFTVVEVLIIIPIVILVIGVFIIAIVNMTGDVLASRSNNVLAYDIQDALDRIEQDVNLSGSFLATNNITLTSPQGYDDNTAAFKNADATTGSMLILNSYATTSNPMNSTRNIMYVFNKPYSCGDSKINQNPAVMMNIIYFVKDNALWRRVIAPSNYQTIGCVGSSVGAPWQQPSCAPDIAISGFCKVHDIKLVEGVQIGGFVTKYYSSLVSETENTTANDASESNTERDAALRTTNSVKVTINATGTIAGHDISQSGTVRAVSPNNNTATTTPDCPSGFITVPGSNTYGTSDFCIMKYEAKDSGDGITPVSTAAGLPWVNVNQINAEMYSPNVVGCTGCHLVTEAEYLTIIQNVLSVDENWSGGTVGSGYIYSGNNDATSTIQAADTVADDGYVGTGDSSSSNPEQRRTLKLTTGQFIWDIAGNAWDWTSGQTVGNEPGSPGAAAWRDWNAVTVTGSLSPNVFPSGTGILGADSWTAALNGIGRLCSSSDSSILHGFLRGGASTNTKLSAGVTAVYMNFEPTSSNQWTSFRVAR